jgi:hypothetical protein
VLVWVPPTFAAGIVLILLLAVARWSPSGATQFPQVKWLASPIYVDSSWDIADSWLTPTRAGPGTVTAPWEGQAVRNTLTSIHRVH